MGDLAVRIEGLGKKYRLGAVVAGGRTLLKILSRITDPTEGCVEIHGRVGSLLEVGTGFHPELTGREKVTIQDLAERPVPFYGKWTGIFRPHLEWRSEVLEGVDLHSGPP